MLITITHAYHYETTLNWLTLSTLDEEHMLLEGLSVASSIVFSSISSSPLADADPDISDGDGSDIQVFVCWHQWRSLWIVNL